MRAISLRASGRMSALPLLKNTAPEASIIPLLMERIERGALAIEPAQHRVRQLAGAESVALLGQFDGLRDGGVRGDAPHLEELVRAEPEQVGEVTVEARESAAHPRHERVVNPAASAQHPVHQLLRPPTIARLEPTAALLDGRSEEHA